jgi:signal transduction histidine kinase
MREAPQSPFGHPPDLLGRSAQFLLARFTIDSSHVRGSHRRPESGVIELSKHVFEPLRIDEDTILYRGRNAIAREVLALTQPELRRNRVLLQTQFADHLPMVLGDKVQLQQVILNPVMNAIEAMNGIAEGARELQVSSQKIIGTRFEPGKEKVEARDVDERGQSAVLIAVRDSGPGLDPTQLQRVFETFYTTKSLGMGMGLAISRSIIEAHQGRLWVTPNAPRGAVFQFTLPCRSGL